MRETSNPVFRSLPKGQGGYAQFGAGAAAYGAQAVHADPYTAQPYTGQQSGPLTIDDVVTKTGITLGVLTLSAIASYILIGMSPAFAPIIFVAAIAATILALVMIFTRRQDNPALVLTYAVLEGIVVGGFSYIVANFAVQGISAGALISQAVVGTLGVFFGMLVVYKTGAIRVTPKFTRFLAAAGIGAVILMIVNLVVGLISGGAGPLRDGGPLAIGFSLLMIALAAFFFLSDFDQADQAIRAGAPAKAAWGIAFGLTMTIVWLYIEILRLLSYFNSD